jgi:hypothetical protein
MARVRQRTKEDQRRLLEGIICSPETGNETCRLIVIDFIKRQKICSRDI